MFEDVKVQNMVIEHLKSIGVNFYKDFEFYGIDGNPCEGIKFRKKADNYDSLE